MKIPNAGRSGYLLIAVVYFFFNSLFLPEGLLYTAILTPFFLWRLYQQQSLSGVIYFFVFTVPFFLIHLYDGVTLWYYFRSYVLLFTSVVFGISFYVFLKKRYEIHLLFSQLLVLNFFFSLVAMLMLLTPAGKGAFWYLKEFSPGIGTLPRLKMLTYEASYYALLFVPIALYFYLRLCLGTQRRAWLIFIMATLPLVLSLSLGVISGIILTFACLFAHRRALLLHRKSTLRFIGGAMTLSLVGLAGLWAYSPHNPLFGRIANIFSGQDTSFRGRTYESFVLAWRIAKEKSVFFGCGPGQAKIVGIEVFKNYYGYLPEVVRIPNTLADTLATYGLSGVLIRLSLTVYLFFKTNVRLNYYQLGLFLFMFIYQFTGSFLTNIVEYTIWILAFTPVFSEFDQQVVPETRGLPKTNRSFQKTHIPLSP